MEISVGTYSSVRYLVEVRYWECPLIESPLYYPTQLSVLGAWITKLKINNIIFFLIIIIVFVAFVAGGCYISGRGLDQSRNYH